MAEGLAPFQRVKTVSLGRSVSGIASMSRRGTAYSPHTISAANSIQVATGWSTKKRIIGTSMGEGARHLAATRADCSGLQPGAGPRAMASV